MAKRVWAGVLVGWWLFVAHGQAAENAPDETASAPWSDLVPIASDIAFDNVRYPHLDAQGNVTFIADDPLWTRCPGTNHGIYRSQNGGKPVCLVRGGQTTVPGTKLTLKLVRGLQMDEKGTDFIFNGLDSAGERGIYLWSNGRLETVSRSGDTVLPGEKEGLRSIEYGAWHGTHLLYQATTAGHATVLVLHDLAAGSDRVLCRTGTAIPGHEDEKFRFIALQNWLDADSILFRAASVAEPGKAGLKGTMGLYGWFGVKDWTGDSGELAPERMRTIVDGDAQVPIHAVPEDATFDAFGSAPVAGGVTVFEASGDNFSGIFVAKTPDGPVRSVASTRTQFGGPFKGHFTEFSGYPTIIGDNVIFAAQAEEGELAPADDNDDDGAQDAKANRVTKTYTGVFVYRLDRKELFVLTDNRAKLGGKRISSFEIGGHFLVDDRFAVTVRFKDNSSQVFLGTIRPEAFKRLNGDPGTAPQKPESGR